jgi:hypothetical protein
VTVPKSYIQHPINTRMSHDHGTIHTSAHTFQTIAIRPIRFKYESYMADTVPQGLVRSFYVSTNCTTKTTTKCCHTQLLDLPRLLAALECIQRKRFTRIEGIQEWPSRPADHSNLLTLPGVMSWGPNNVYQSNHDF